MIKEKNAFYSCYLLPGIIKQYLLNCSVIDGLVTFIYIPNVHFFTIAKRRREKERKREKKGEKKRNKG